MRSTMILRTGSSNPEGPGASAKARKSWRVSSPEPAGVLGRVCARAVAVRRASKKQGFMAAEWYSVQLERSNRAPKPENVETTKATKDLEGSQLSCFSSVILRVLCG